MIYLVNYSDENFLKHQMLNTKSAFEKGDVDYVFQYSPNDIDSDFRAKHQSILNHKRGAGLWLWKSYFLKLSLDRIKDGDYLFYCDSGAIFINSLKYLIDILNKSDIPIMLFELPLIAKQWTKKECFYELGCTDEQIESIGNENQILGSYFLLKKTSFTVNFAIEFLQCCCNEKALSPVIFNNMIKNDSAFIEHREDQSIFNIISRKHNIIPFKEPTQYGLRPWEYLENNYLYNPKLYPTSKYPIVLISTRSNVNYKRLILKFYIKNILYKFSIFRKLMTYKYGLKSNQMISNY